MGEGNESSPQGGTESSGVSAGSISTRCFSSSPSSSSPYRTAFVINTGEVEAQLREDLNLPPLVTRRRPHPAHLETLNPVNKQLKHPD